MKKYNDERNLNMKAVSTKIPIFLSAIALLVMLASCPNPFNGIDLQSSVPAEKGRVMVSLGDPLIKSLIPLAPDFTRYILSFTADGKTEVKAELIAGADDNAIANLNGNGYGIDLEPGLWTLTVTAYTGTGPDYNAAARNAAPVSVTVSGGSSTSQPVTITPILIDPALRGTLAWNISFSGFALSDLVSATLEYKKTTDSAAVSVDLKINPSGSIDLPSGYYEVIILLSRGNDVEAGRREAAHIYPGLTTNAPFTFGTADFVSMKYLAGTAVLADSSTFISGSGLTVTAYSDSAYTIPVTTNPGTVLVTDSKWKMKVPVDVESVYFKLETSLTYNNSLDGTYSGAAVVLAGAHTSIPPNGAAGIQLSLPTGSIAAHGAGGSGFSGSFHDTLQNAIDASGGTENQSDTITLLADISINTEGDLVTVPSGKFVKLIASGTGKTISRDASWLGSLITVASGSSLELAGDTDLTIDGKKGNGITAVGPLVSVNGTLKMSGNSVTLQNNNNSVGDNNINGGGVYVGYGGVFTMSGGSITGNKASSNGGGGVYVGGAFTMSGTATIDTTTDNEVYLADGKYIIIDGTLTSNATHVANIIYEGSLIPDTTQLLSGSPNDLAANYQKFLYNGDLGKINASGKYIIEAYDITITEANLDQMKSLVAEAAEAGFGNSSEYPINVIITIANESLLSGSNSEGTDSLHKLFDAIPDGKYVSYDLSGCTFTSFGDITTYDIVNARTNTAYLAAITLPDTLTLIGDFVFQGCSSLTEVIIPNSVTSIGRWAFSGCSGLTSVTIPNGVTSIGYGAFYSCIGLTSVTIGDSVASIGIESFNGCTNLSAIQVNDNNTFYTSIEGVLFSKSGTELIVYPANKGPIYIIPDSVTSIIDRAFEYCSGLISVTIPNSVTSIGEGVFSVCTGLTSVTIPDSVTSIGMSVFWGCSSLTSVIIGNGITVINPYTFEHCSGLTSVMIPNSVTSISGAFGFCTNLTEIQVYENNTAFTSIEGVLFNKLGTELIAYPAAKGPLYTIPVNVTSINGWAFHGCIGLTSVTIPDSVTTIGTYAFYDCTNLTSVYIQRATEPLTTLDSSAFSSPSDSLIIYVPTAVLDVYKTADGWKDYADRIQADGSDPFVPVTTYTVSIGTLQYGSITADPQNGPAGTAINLTITPNSGYRLKADTLKYNDGTDHAITGSSFNLPAANVTISAEFDLITLDLEINFSPLIPDQIIDLTPDHHNDIRKGTNDEVLITVGGSGDQYKWYLDGQLIEYVTGSSYTLSGSSTLTVGLHRITVIVVAGDIPQSTQEVEFRVVL
jgi:hypothetical protein